MVVRARRVRPLSDTNDDLQCLRFPVHLGASASTLRALNYRIVDLFLAFQFNYRCGGARPNCVGHLSFRRLLFRLFRGILRHALSIASEREETILRLLYGGHRVRTLPRYCRLQVVLLKEIFGPKIQQSLRHPRGCARAFFSLRVWVHFPVRAFH